MFPNSTSGFGHENVSGRRRVPKPPTRIRAFILRVLIGSNLSAKIVRKMRNLVLVLVVGFSVIMGAAGGIVGVVEVQRHGPRSPAY